MDKRTYLYNLGMVLKLKEEKKEVMKKGEEYDGQLEGIQFEIEYYESTLEDVNYELDPASVVEYRSALKEVISEYERRIRDLKNRQKELKESNYLQEKKNTEIELENINHALKVI